MQFLDQLLNQDFNAILVCLISNSRCHRFKIVLLARDIIAGFLYCHDSVSSYDIAPSIQNFPICNRDVTHHRLQSFGSAFFSGTLLRSLVTVELPQSYRFAQLILQQAS
ncbi:putative 30S ribosomal protein S17-like protein [Fusarium oxysporum f. sp. albedinis]|nr:putative 30S ribosomal protein S17-like protein [Fusarium oxysporum f. sp. albedinis]